MHLEVAQISKDWSTFNHIISLRELQGVAELAHANLLDSVKYMILINIEFPRPCPSNVDDLFTLRLCSLSRKVNGRKHCYIHVYLSILELLGAPRPSPRPSASASVCVNFRSQMIVVSHTEVGKVTNIEKCDYD